MKVNPLMTVWLLSCVITNSGLAGADRYSNYRYDKKNFRGASELARLYGKDGSLASYKLNVLRLLSAEKKKKNKTSETTTTEFDACASSSSTTAATTTKPKKGAKTSSEDSENNDDPCLSLLSSTTTAKNKKGTKKTKTRSTTPSGKDGGYEKNSNGNYNMINSGSSNKWKKIQKFFFGPPSWSFNKSYKAYGPTTNEVKYKEPLSPMQVHQHPKEEMYDQTTYLHPIPNITNYQYKDKLFVKEEISRKITPRWETLNSKGQINDVNSTNNPSKQQPNEIEKIQPWKFYENDVSKEPIIQEGKFLSTTQETVQDRMSSMEPIEKTIVRTPSMYLGQQEAIISRPWLLKQEEFTSRQEELSESDKISPTEEAKLPPQDLPSEPEKELRYKQENLPATEITYNSANIPSYDQIESTQNINNNNQEIIFTDSFQTPNIIETTEAIDEGQLQLKTEEITDKKKEKYEVSMVREDPGLSFKPEATIELERPLNQTNMENPYSSNNQNYGIKSNKWKPIFDFNEPDYEHLKNLYSNIMNRHVTENDLVTSRIENKLAKIMKSNLNNIYSTNYENNMTDTSNVFIKAFGNFLKNDIPEIFPHHTVEKLFTTSEQTLNDVEKDNAYNQKVKQYFFCTETELPTEQINNSNKVQATYDNYNVLNKCNADDKYNIETTMMPKHTNENLEMLEPNFESNDASIQKTMDGNISTISSTTIIKQYNINLWPKYTDKLENSIDNTSFNTQSIVHSTNPVPWMEISSSSSNHLRELNPTRAADNGPTETTGRFSKSSEYPELPKETKTFETLITLPLIFTDKDTETNNVSPATKITTTKHVGHQSLLNLTLHPMLFDNLWGIQSYLNYSSDKPTSTTPNVFHDDKIAFESIHEFNSDHHFQSTTLQSFFSNAISSEWVPFNIPLVRNEFGIISPNTVKISEVTQVNLEKNKDFSYINDLMNKLLKKSEMSYIERNNKRNLTSLSKHFSFPIKINRGNSLMVNRLHEIPVSMNKINKQVSYHRESVNDPIWNEIMYRTKLRKEKIQSRIENESKSKKPPIRNQIHQNPRKPSFLKEEIIGDDLINLLAFPKFIVNNKLKDDGAKFLTENFPDNFKKIELMASKMNGKNFDSTEIPLIKSGNDKTATQVINNDLKFRSNLNFWSNLNGPFTTDVEVFKESTNKFEQGYADDYNRNATRWSMVEFQGKNVSSLDENKVDQLSIHNNETSTKQPSATLLKYNKPIMSSNGWYVHNEQNEKLLATEKNFDGQFPISTTKPINLQKEIESDHLKNSFGFLNSIMNQTLPEIKNSSDINKNEFSAIQMSAIKIIKKKPEDTFESPIYDPFKNILSQNGNTEINREMSQMFMKMQDFANKLAMKKILLKRGITAPQNNSIEIDGLLRNKCSDRPANKTMTLPFYANLTHSKSKRSFSTLKSDEKGDINNSRPMKITDKWRYNMQSLIDKQNEKRNSDLKINNDDVKKHSDILLSMYKIKPTSNSDENIFNDKSKKRNVVGNKKMKSRELEFILDKNLPRLPLNKRQFIAYMMTGLKGSGNPISSEDEKRSQLSKAYLQNLIDINVKKDKVVDFTNNKRQRKKQWQTNSVP